MLVYVHQARHSLPTTLFPHSHVPPVLVKCLIIIIIIIIIKIISISPSIFSFHKKHVQEVKYFRPPATPKDLGGFPRRYWYPFWDNLPFLGAHNWQSRSCLAGALAQNIPELLVTTGSVGHGRACD